MDPGEWIEFGGDYEYQYCASAGLFRAGRRIPLGTLQSELLELLVSASSAIVLREDLVQKLWRTPNISKNSLHELVSTLRKALGDSSKAPRFIKTEKNRGYRWIAPVRRIDAPAGNAAQTLRDAPPDRAVTGAMSLQPGESRIKPRRFIAWMVAVLALHQLFAEWAEAAFVFGNLDAFALLAPLNSILVLAASAAGLWYDWVRTSQQRSNGFGGGIAIAVGGLTVVVALALWFLPPRSEITLASFAMAPRAGFIKSALIYPTILSVTFLHLPFHIVAALNVELSLGRSRNVYALICGRRTGVSPMGTVFVRPVIFAWIFAGLAAAGIPMTLVLLSGLNESPASSFFSQLALLRFVTWWGTAVACLVWYVGKLNQMKHVALSR